MRLIDADELLTDPYFQDESMPERELFIEAVADSPTIDAVEVVRCKDCKHYRGGTCGHITYIMDGYYRNTYEVKRPDDFCSIGEKMDEEVRSDA